LDGIVQGLLLTVQPSVLAFIFLGTILGTIFGVVPGISGMTLLAVLLPFTFGMQPAEGLALLMAGNAVCHVGGAVTSVLLAIPGDPPNAATILDGFPMTQQGKGGRALGAALTAATVGGIFGIVAMAVMIPILRPIVLLFGFPETFLVVLMGITFIAVLGKGSMIKGLISGGIGIFLTFVGYQAVSGIPRLSPDILYLLYGFKLIPIALGLFAIPELMELVVEGGTIAKLSGPAVGKGDVIEGIKDVFRHWWLVVRCGVIGIVVGIAPAAGAETSPWIAYGYAKQVSKHPEEFGKGSVEGVIAPQVAVTSVKGGDLVPTLSFGIPGSSSMAVLLGGFLIMGLTPGPFFLKEHLDIAFSLVFSLAIAFVITGGICLLLASRLTKVALVPGSILAPIILIFTLLGAYCAENDMNDVLMTFVFGALGYTMMRFGYNRPALLLGFVLGNLLETTFHISVQTRGWLFFTSPISIILILIMILTPGYPLLKAAMRRMRG